MLDQQNINDFIWECRTTNTHLYPTYKDIADKVNEVYALSGRDRLSPDAIRCRVNRMKKHSLLPVVNKLEDEKSREQRVEDRRRALEERADRAIESEREHEEAIVSLIAQAIERGLSVADIRPYEPEPGRDYTLRRTNKEEAVLQLSDLHFGKKTHLYNLDVAKERLNRIFDTALKLCQRHDIEVLNILLLGDIVDGESIYPSHPHHIDASALEQIFSSIEAFIPRIRECASLLKKVRIYTVPGNHGRVTKHYNEKTNFDSLFAQALHFATKDIPNLEFNMNYDWKYVTDINGVKFLMFHGHQIKMTLNLPHYGITTRISRWVSTETFAGVNVAVHGHFHTSISQKWNDVAILSNGTIVEGDEFALEHVGLEASQTQWFYGVHPEHKITFRYELSAKRLY